MNSPRVAVVVGNPKPQSRTLAAARLLAGELAGSEPDLVVVATPKASFAGLLTLLPRPLRRGQHVGRHRPADARRQTRAQPAPEFTLRPVLTEISATSSAKGLYVVDAEHDQPQAYAGWLDANRASVQTLVRALSVAQAPTRTRTRTSTSEVSA